MVLGLIGAALEEVGIGGLSSDQQKNRQVFIEDWNKLVGKKADLAGDTIVIYVQNTSNPFQNKEDFAMEHHPRSVNGQSCEDIGIKFIQVRSLSTDQLLSGARC